MDEEQARELIGRYWQAAHSRDFDTVSRLFSDDVLVEWPQSGERVRGKEACISVFANYPGGSPKFLGLKRVMGIGDMWVSEAEFDYPGPRRYLVVSVFELRDGLINHEIDYFAEPFPAPEWRMQWVDRG